MSTLATRLYDQAVSWLAKADPTHREILYASLFLVVIFIVGTFGYKFLEGWYWFDGFYQTFVTITTIGFGEVDPLTTSGRLFTILLALSGIGTVGIIGTRITQMLVSSQRLRERHMQKQIERLSDHYILCGYGTVGARIARDFEETGQPIIIIDNDDEVIEELQETSMLYIEGEAEEEDVLREAGIEKAHGLILALPEDSANVFVTLVAREMNPDIFILARTTYHRNRRKLTNAGADKVIAPDEVGADRMAQVILRPTVDQFMEEVLRTGALGLEMEEVKIEEGSMLAGRSLADSNFRQQFEAIVIGVLDQDADVEMKFNPDPQDHLQAGDILVVLGNNEMIKRLRQVGCKA